LSYKLSKGDLFFAGDSSEYYSQDDTMRGRENRSVLLFILV